MAPSLINKELLSTASDKFFLTTIRDGRPGTGMPPFAHLEEGRIKAIIAFIRSHSQLPNKAVEIDSQPAPTVIPDWGNSGLDKFVRLVMARKAMVMLQVVRVPRNEIICTQNNNFATSKAIK